MRSFILIIFALTTLVSTYAKTIVITVGGNTTNDATTVFQPNTVVALTQGNHTVTQSTFASPCIPAHDTDSTINGFDSSFRNAGNGTAITNLPYTVTDANTTIWFYDFNLCSQGGVGAINVNESSTETIDGFQRNAQRLNGTAPSSSSHSSSASKTTTATSTNPASTSNDATSVIAYHAVPFLLSFFGVISALML
ncbi:hypothetical protein FPV67DRAFT_1448419 [Lyophyllum atratum]|nr:hypothetical protein FPV67DRAFT_1448419 [Lyophyllum atratum]